MKKSKKIFLTIALTFFILVLYLAYDISTRTTFPGQRPVDKELNTSKDSLDIDSFVIDSIHQE